MQQSVKGLLIATAVSATDKRMPIDDLVAKVIKANGRRTTLPNKKRVLELIYQLQSDKVLKLENGVAILT